MSGIFGPGLTAAEAAAVRGLVDGTRFSAGKYKRVAFLGDSFFEPLGDISSPFPPGSSEFAATNGVTYGVQMGGTWTGAGQLNELGLFAVYLQPYYGFTHPTTWNVRFDGVNGLACKLSSDASYGAYVNVTGGGFFVLESPTGLRMRAVIRWRNRPAGAAVSNPTTTNALSLIPAVSMHSIASRIYMQSGIANSTVACFGISGDNSDDMLARVGQVTRWQPDLVILCGGVNDYGAVPTISAAKSVSNYLEIWDALASAGAHIAHILPFPSGDPTLSSAGALAIRRQLLAIRHGLINAAPSNNVFLIDPMPYTENPSSANGGVTTSMFDAQFIHINGSGASSAAVGANAALANLGLSANTAGGASVVDAYDATFNPSGNWLGTVGKFIGSVTPGGFVTGNVPAGITLSRSGADIVCTSTCPNDATVPRTDGKLGHWFRLVVSGASTDTQHVEALTAALTPASFGAAAGDFVRFRGTLRVTSLTRVREIRIVFGTTDNANYCNAASYSSASLWTDAADNTFSVVSPLLKLQAATNLRVTLRIATNSAGGTATVDMQDWCVEKAV
jgi:hypothetical protein